MIVAGALGGMAWAAIPAFLKVKANANEILVTLMLNYVASLLLSYLVNGPMQDPEGMNYPQTAPFDPSAMFSPLFEGMRINGSIFITAAICYLVLGNSDKVARALGDTGIRILVRIMGLLLVALAVQYFVNGMADRGVIAKPS